MCSISQRARPSGIRSGALLGLRFCLVILAPRRGGLELHLERLRLRTMLLWLFEVAVEMYGLVDAALTERPLPKSVVT